MFRINKSSPTTFLLNLSNRMKRKSSFTTRFRTINLNYSTFWISSYA